VAAGALLVKEAGGVLRDLRDDGVDPIHSGRMLAANPDVADPLLTLLRSA
jgi:myo-inositol-1(or 4)-monophosphatase